MEDGRSTFEHSPICISSFTSVFATEPDRSADGEMALGQIVVDDKIEQDAVTDGSLAPSLVKSSIGTSRAHDPDGSDFHGPQQCRSRSATLGLPHESTSGSKRKHGEPFDTGTGDDAIQHETAKRQKPFDDIAPVHLPMELWQQVFLYLSPAMLCRCLRVCKSFNRYLTEEIVTSVSSTPNKERSKVCANNSEAIWTNSRRSFYPSMPRPLARLSELAMLRLIVGSNCQFCNRKSIPSLGTTPFNAGPGPDGCRVIWPFAIRSCGTCLESRSLKVRPWIRTLKRARY
jgi:hypothetical protein